MFKKLIVLFSFGLAACSAGGADNVVWSVQNVTAVESAALLEENTDLIVLDVRTPREFAEGHIEGAVNIDFYAEDFKAQLGEFDKSKTYLVHCRSGNRSNKSLATFQELGLTTIIHMDGGMNAWMEADLPVVR